MILGGNTLLSMLLCFPQINQDEHQGYELSGTSWNQFCCSYSLSEEVLENSSKFFYTMENLSKF